MIPTINKWSICYALHGQPLQYFMRKLTAKPNFARAVVVSRSLSSCSCGTLKPEERTNVMRKSVGLLKVHFPIIPTSSQWSLSISQSCAVTTNAGVQGSGAAVGGNGTQWDLFAGILVERKPIITAKKTEIQEKYANFLDELEFELSKKSDHEIRNDNDLKMLEKVKAGEIDLGNVQTAKDDEDRWNAEAQGFQPASRETEADKKNDTKSLDRALDSHLLLVVEQKLGNDYRWICPHAKLEQGETLRQAAEKMLRAMFPDMRAKVLGNAPWGFYKYKYPKCDSSALAVGAKVFFYKAQVVSGEAKEENVNEIVKDFVWLKRDELVTKLQPEYYKKLSECLIDE